MTLKTSFVYWCVVAMMTIGTLAAHDSTMVNVLTPERILNPGDSLKIFSVRAFGRIKVAGDGAVYFRGEGTKDEAQHILRAVREMDWKRDDSAGDGAPFQTASYCHLSFRLQDGEVRLFCAAGFVMLVKIGDSETWYAHSEETSPMVDETFKIAAVIEKFLIEKRSGWKILPEPVEDGWFFKGFGKK